MKKLIRLLLALVVLLSLSSCGDGTSNTADIIPEQSTRGTLSNPYSMSDTIEFTSWKFDYTTDDKGELQETAQAATIKISNISLRDDIVFDSFNNGESYWFATFLCEVTESDTDDPVSIDDQDIRFSTINTDGVKGGNFVYTFYNTADVPDFSQLEILPGYSVEVGALLVNENGGELSLITLEYRDSSKDLHTVYIDPNA